MTAIMEQAAETAFITPMRPWAGIGAAPQAQTEETKAAETSLFGSVLQKAVGQVYETQADVEQKQYLLATGRLDDAHSLPIAQQKAALSLDVLVSLRNKTLESYNELLKMNV